MFQPSTTKQDFTFKAVRLQTSILCSTEIIKCEGCLDVFSGGFYRCSSSLQCVGKKEHNFRENIEFKIPTKNWNSMHGNQIKQIGTIRLTYDQK